MNSTCIRHPERQPLIQIKAWQVYASEGNYCAAALLSFFEYWHNYKLDEQEKSAKRNYVAEAHGEEKVYDESLFQFHTEKELSNGLLGLYGETAINDAIKFLEKKGYISIHRNPNPKFKFDNTKHYLFHASALQKYIDEEYPERLTAKGLGEKLTDRFSKKKKTGSRKGETTPSQGETTSPEGENTGTITEITSEITPEITFSLSSSQSSEEGHNQVINVSGIPEGSGQLVGVSTDLAIIENKVETPSGNLVKSEKKKTKRDLVNEKANDPAFIDFFQKLRNNYTFFSGNKFLRDFGSHKVQFYKTLAYRVANEEVNKVDIEVAFSFMERNIDFSIIQFLEKLKNNKYMNNKILVDFIWIMTDGKVAAPIAERKGAKDLSEWVEDGKTSLTEIEDCFYWMPQSGRSYGVSLLSVKSALKEFDKVKTSQNGRFVGKSLNSFKTQSEKTVEILQNRDYAEMAENSIAYGEARRKQWDELVQIADGE